MPQSKLNEHLRWLIVERTLEGLSCRRIAGELNISKSSVSRTYLHFKKYGCVEDLSPSLALGRGRSRILTVDDIKYLENLLKEKIDWYLWELQSEMELWLGHHIGYSTIWRAIHRLGYTHKQVNILTFVYASLQVYSNLFIYLFYLFSCLNQQKSVMKMID
jgi:transposase